MSEEKSALDEMEKLPGLEIKYIYSSGPGGQNVNKVATCAQLRYDLSLSGLTEEQMSRLRRLAPGQLTQGGEVLITARRHRSQILNKKDALLRLAALLAQAKMPPPKPRKQSRPSKRAVERRLSEKRVRSIRKVSRSKVNPDE